MSPKAQSFFYLGVLVFAFLSSLVRYKRVDRAAKILPTMLGVTLLSEFLGYVFAIKYHNNMPVYHFFAPTQLILIILYFSRSIDVLKTKKTWLYFSIIGIIAGIVNTLFLQPLDTFNTYYLLFEGICIISFCLFAFYRMLENDDTAVLNNPHFWVSCIFLFFWCTTYINWALYKILGTKMHQMMPFIGISIWIINIITYLGLASVFLFYPKKRLSSG